MKVVCDSSPLIFLVRLGLLKTVLLQSSENFYLPQSVATEIEMKQDEANSTVRDFIASRQLEVRTISLVALANRLNRHLGKGESEAIALAVELSADHVLLDDVAARKEALRLGLHVKGTLAVIKKLQSEGTIQIDNLDELYQRLVTIKFRVKKTIFDKIFKQ